MLLKNPLKIILSVFMLENLLLKTLTKPKFKSGLTWSKSIGFLSRKLVCYIDLMATTYVGSLARTT